MRRTCCAACKISCRSVDKGVPKQTRDTTWNSQKAEVGIYGLALNPKRRKIGWLASYLERGGREGIGPRSKGPISEKHANTIL